MSEQNIRVNALLAGQREATAQAVIALTERCGLLAADLAWAQAQLKELQEKGDRK